MRILCVLGVILAALPAQAQVTNFSLDVATAIERGLDWLEAQGHFANPSAGGDAAGLVALALLEKRVSADQNAAPSGYANATPRDQGRIAPIMAFVITRAQVSPFYAYR